MAFLPVVQPAGFETSDSKVITLSASSANGMTSPITPKSAAGRMISGIRLRIQASLNFSSAPSGTFYVGANTLGEVTVTKGNTTLLQFGNGSANTVAIADLQAVYHILTGGSLPDSQLVGTPNLGGFLDTGIIPVSIASDVPLVVNVKSQPISIPNFTGGTLTVTAYFCYANAQTPVNSAGQHYDTHIVRVASSSTYSAGQEYAISQEFNIAAALSEVWVNVGDDPNINYFTFKTGSTDLLQKVDDNALVDMETIFPPQNSFYVHINGLFKAPVPVGSVFLPTGASSTQNQLIANFSTQQTASLIYYLVVQA